MKNKFTFIKIAGFINLLTALIHTIGGQLDLVTPLLATQMGDQQKTEWIGVWHVITVLLFTTSFYLLKMGFNKTKVIDRGLVQFIGMVYILSSIPFILSSIFMKGFAPQWILLFPIGALCFLALKRN